jgi:hypothetical protein
LFLPGLLNGAPSKVSLSPGKRHAGGSLLQTSIGN